MPVQDVQFTLTSLPEAQRAEAKALSAALSAAVFKGLLHRLEPATYKVSGKVTDLETQAAVAVEGIAPAVFERMVGTVRKLAEDPEAVRRLTGGLTAERLTKAGVVVAPRGGSSAVPRSSSSPQSTFKRLDLNLRALHCVDETGENSGEWGTDDMVLGALRIGANGNADYTKAIVAGEFDENDDPYRSYGELPFGSFSMRSTPGFPKTVYCIFQLVESDSDDGEVAAGVTGALQTVVQLVATAAGSSGLGALAGGIVDALGSLIQLFIDDETFAPYSVAITVNSDKEFGADGVEDRHTGNISGHGGTYRIGYRLRLVK